MKTTVIIVWMVVLLVVQPVAGWLGKERVAGTRASRRRLYLSSALGIAAIGMITLGIDLYTGKFALRAVLGGLAPRRLAILSAEMFAICAAIWVGTQLTRRARRRGPGAAYMALLPRAPGEKVLFTANSLWAGLIEEYAYRGFCLLQLKALTGSWGVAFALTSVGFGFGHAYRGDGAAIRTSLIGAVLAVPVILTGSVLPSMIGHATLDVLTGLWGYRLFARWGLVSPEAAIGSPATASDH